MINPIELPIKWEDLIESDPGVLHGQVIIFGQYFHIEAFQVVEVEGFNTAVNEEFMSKVEELEDWVQGSFQKVRNGDREYILVITPHCQ